MKEKLKRFYKDFILAVVIILGCVLIVFMISILSQYSSVMAKQAKINIKNDSSDTRSILVNMVDSYTTKAKAAAEMFRYCQNEQDMQMTETAVMEKFQTEKIYYFRDGIEGKVFDHGGEIRNAPSRILTLRGEEPKSSGVIYDNHDMGLRVMAFYAPVAESDILDGVVLFYTVGDISASFEKADEELLEKAEFVSICNYTGEVLEVLHTRTEKVGIYENIFSILRTRTNQKEVVDEIERMMNEGVSDVLQININGEDYAISVGSSGTKGGGVCVIGFYLLSDAFKEGYSLLNTVLAAVIVLFLVTLFFIIYFIFTRMHFRKMLHAADTTDIYLDCPNAKGFSNTAEIILQRNRMTRFAVVVSEIQHFSYIDETFGYSQTTSALNYLKTMFSKALQTEETYAFIKDGRFALLLHYRDREELISRLKVLLAIAYNYPDLRQQDYHLELRMGIYELDRKEPLEMQKFLSRAIVALETKGEIGNTDKYKFYNESMGARYMQDADIESRMEKAIKEHEFKVFYQPKYNIHQNRPDGAEALVRWYDGRTGTYVPPAEFIPLFEANGFIVRLDKYVYTQVCMYIREAVTLGQKLVPISVNVSRVTAIQPDFISFYTRTRKKFGIADRFITLEFTESFAYENYEHFSEVVKEMHENGFNCSIDDFGTGYSSYNVLKALPMDEIKLDRIFLQKGITKERDEKIFQSVISLAKDLGMKVTQEGVETSEELELIKKLGCDVVQGYFYSKPLVLTDYVKFLNSKQT